MGNCIRTEMWKAFHNKMMRRALLIGFILVIADLVQTAITVSDLGASYTVAITLRSSTSPTGRSPTPCGPTAIPKPAAF